jgi:prepilin-type N-terminal cleavage/methylation domain-containing protein
MATPGRRGNSRGLTLVELLISMTILGIVAASIPLLLESGSRGVEVQQRILNRELTFGRLFQEWEVDVAAAHGGVLVTDGCVLFLEGGDVRYRMNGDEMYREMKTKPAATWVARPMRALATLQPGMAPVFVVNAASASVEITGLEQPLRAVAAFRRSAP